MSSRAVFSFLARFLSCHLVIDAVVSNSASSLLPDILTCLWINTYKHGFVELKRI